MTVKNIAGVILGAAVLLALGVWVVTMSQRPLDGIRGKQARITVAATIFPLADMVKQIGGEDVDVVLVVPAGVTEHANTLTPQKLQELQLANIIFQIGHGLDDPLVERIQAAVPGLTAVVVNRGIALREFASHEEEEPEHEEGEEEHHHDEGIDPHYWLTVPNAMEMAETVARELMEADSEHGPAYAGRLADYQRRLVELETELQEQAQGAAHKEFIAMHNAWSYFAAQYGFRLVATYEPTEGREPSLSDLAHLKELVRQYGLTTFYAEPQKTSSAVTQFMQREFGLKVLVLDPVGGQLGRENYVDLMRFNMEAMTAG